METIEIEFKQSEVSDGIHHTISDEFHIDHRVMGTHPDGLVSVRFMGDKASLESLVEHLFPGDELEAYMLV